jgi:hypothetical protein
MLMYAAQIVEVRPPLFIHLRNVTEMEMQTQEPSLSNKDSLFWLQKEASVQ